MPRVVKAVHDDAGLDSQRQAARRGRRRRRERWLLAAAVVFALMPGSNPHAEPAKPLDYEVKAVYLLNFALFATWPPLTAAADGEGFVMCVIGRDPFGPTLDATVAGELIDGKTVVTRRIARLEDAAGCRMLFVSGSEDGQLKAILQAVDQTAVLTVSDMPQFVERGGMIQFVSVDSKVRFAINLIAAKQAGLMVSSALLRVAVSVKTAKPEA